MKVFLKPLCERDGDGVSKRLEEVILTRYVKLLVFVNVMIDNQPDG